MKRRYSNFHRARKYHRKYLSTRRTHRFILAGRYYDQYEKYDTAAYYLDGVNTALVNLGTPRERLIIRAHFDPVAATAHLSPELKYCGTVLNEAPLSSYNCSSNLWIELEKRYAEGRDQHSNLEGTK